MSRTIEISERNLEELRWYKINWNNGIIHEYWKSFNENDDTDIEYRLGIRFGERKDRDFMVWIIIRNSCMIPVPKIRKLTQLDILLNLLKRNMTEMI